MSGGQFDWGGRLQKSNGGAQRFPQLGQKSSERVQRQKKAAKKDKGSAVPNKNKVGRITKAQVEEIAKIKMPDLNANDIEAAMRMVEGTARSMGIEVAR